MRFFVCLPTFNRAHTLPRALGSLIGQTHKDWQCVIFDDGSHDGTNKIALDFAAKDSRIGYVRFNTNRGGVAMNVEGMTAACNSSADSWTRLGSDDWYGPRKLELDVIALQTHEACWGCYDAMPHNDRHGLSRTAAHAKNDLMWCQMRASWANCAVRIDVLRKVRAQFGFEIPGSRNLEDLTINARIAAVADWRWRGIVSTACRPISATYCDRDEDGLRSEIFEAAWSDSPGGCTSNVEQCRVDMNESARAISILRTQIGYPNPP